MGHGSSCTGPQSQPWPLSWWQPPVPGLAQHFALVSFPTRSSRGPFAWHTFFLLLDPSRGHFSRDGFPGSRGQQ